MLKSKLLVTLLLLFVFPVVNQAQTEKSLLWKISGNNLEKPSYLFGTIHIIPEEEFIFTDLMQEKFNSCQTLVLEADINIPVKEQIALAQKMLLPKDKTLKDYMTDEQFAEYKSYMIDAFEIKENKFKQIIKLKPVFSTALILNEIVKKATAYEMELSKFAKKQKMESTFLEILDYQMNIINKITIEEQVEMMFADEQSMDALTAYKNLLTAYKTGDLDKLAELMKADPSYKKFEKELLTDRNTNWIPLIEDIVKKQSAFIAVGSTHLPGDEGVISLLKKQGYEVTPVN